MAGAAVALEEAAGVVEVTRFEVGGEEVEGDEEGEAVA